MSGSFSPGAESFPASEPVTFFHHLFFRTRAQGRGQFRKSQKGVVLMSLTAVPGVQVGCHTDLRAQTGLTVILFKGETPAVASAEIRGGAPGTRDTELLRPEGTVPAINALLFSGGSAYGLDAAAGVMQYLSEQGRGFSLSERVVPIVPGAVIFDLDQGLAAVPGPREAYQACQQAASGPVPEGAVGAGTGARVGKVRGNSLTSRGGQGTASVRLAGEGTVAALAVVNAVGDVIAEDGSIVAGARNEGGGFLNTEDYLLAQSGDSQVASAQNTTLVAVVTDVQLDKAQCLQVAKLAHTGLARAIRPCHTPYDGDAVFVVSCGTRRATVLETGVAASRSVAAAIRRAVRE